MISGSCFRRIVYPGCSRCNRGDVFSVSIRTEHPCHKVILVFEMIIEHWAFYICRCTDLCYANLVDEFVREKAGRYALTKTQACLAAQLTSMRNRFPSCFTSCSLVPPNFLSHEADVRDRKCREGKGKQTNQMRPDQKQALPKRQIAAQCADQLCI